MARRAERCDTAVSLNIPVAQGVARRSAAGSKAGLLANGLTRREREVASRIAQGSSNRQIASELVVTERTVEGHVSNILFKLGFHSRAQISAWVVETGLATP